MSGSITASRYTNALRYNPFRLSTGRYPGMPPASAVPSLPVTETPIGAYPQAPVPDAAAPPPAAPAAETPVYSGAAPVDWRPDNGEGGGVGSGGAGDPFSGNYGGLGDNSLGGMPGPSPDQSIGGLLGALATGAGFAMAPVGAMAGMLAGVVNDVERGQQVGTSRSMTDVMAQVLGLTPPSQMISDAFSSKPDAAPTGVDYAAVPGPEKGPDSEGMGTGGGSQPDAVGAAMASAQGDYDALADAALGLGMGGGGGEGAGGTGAGGSTDAVGAGMAGAQGDYGGMAEAAAGMGLFQEGGYTGAGPDAMVQPEEPAGTVHEGEVVLNAKAAHHYGPNILLALNARKVPANALRRLVDRYV